MDALVGNSSVNGGSVQCLVRFPEGSHRRFYWAGLKENAPLLQCRLLDLIIQIWSVPTSSKPMRFCAATGWLIFPGMACWLV